MCGRLGALIFFAAVASASADPLNVIVTRAGVGQNWYFRYDIREPQLNVGQKISTLSESVSVLTSKVGMNNNPANTDLQGKLFPNPLIIPEPNCARAPQDCILLPLTLGGVDPRNLQTGSDQFFLNQSASSLTKGNNTNIAGDPANRKAPIAGSTQRTDTVALVFDASNPIQFFPTRIAGQNVDALTFGAVINYDRGSFTNANNKSQSLPSRESFEDCLWTLDDGSTIGCRVTEHTIRMGMNELDPNGTLLAGLVFSYTNDAPNAVNLSNLGFQTCVAELPLDELGLIGTSLFNPVVTLNGTLQPLSADYLVPAGYTLQFLFPETTDPFFIVHGDVSGESAAQFGFAYQEQVLQVPEPTTLLLSGLALIVLLRSRQMTRSLLRKS